MKEGQVELSRHDDGITGELEVQAQLLSLSFECVLDCQNGAAAV